MLITGEGTTSILFFLFPNFNFVLHNIECNVKFNEMNCFPFPDNIKNINVITLGSFFSVSSTFLQKLDYNSFLAFNLIDSFNCKIKHVKIKTKSNEVEEDLS